MPDNLATGFNWRAPIRYRKPGEDLVETTVSFPIGGSSRVRIHAKMQSATGAQATIKLGRFEVDDAYELPQFDPLTLGTTETVFQTENLFGEQHLTVTFTGTGVFEYFDVCQL